MARFILKGAEYDLVDVDDLTFQEISDMETHTGFDMAAGKVSVPGLVWISVRRRFPQTTWEDLAQEKLLKIEWLEDEDEQSLPPISAGANGSSAADAPTVLVAPTDTGNPG